MLLFIWRLVNLFVASIGLRLQFMDQNSMGKTCDALRDLVQFKKQEKHAWRGITFSKVADESLQQNWK